MVIPNTRIRKLNSKLHLHSIHSLRNVVFQRRYLERQSQSQSINFIHLLYVILYVYFNFVLLLVLLLVLVLNFF
jgi:hypothetical protein